jgi:hypothetical protein
MDRYSQAYSLIQNSFAISANYWSSTEIDNNNALNEMLLVNSNKPLQQQNSLLQQSFSSWKRNLEQVDDVLIMGIKI